MYRTAYILLSVLVLLGSTVPAAAHDDCTGKPTGTPCDDHIFCNGRDWCVLDPQGESGCIAHDNRPCPDTENVCNNVCNELAGDCYAAKGDPCPDDSNICTDDECNGSGECVHPPKTGYIQCDDGTECTTNDACNEEGICAGVSRDCNDNNDCTDDSCNPATGCLNTFNTAPCDDGSACTISDRCSGGACAGIFVNCDDNNVCTDDLCDPATGCLNPPNTDPCDDGVFCNGSDTCENGECHHAGDPCADKPECANVCNEAVDKCAAPPGTACTDDGNPCTDNVCNDSGQCISKANNDTCDDGLYCNGDDQCSGGACRLHTGDPCAAESECALMCDEEGDTCAIPLGIPCSPDGNPCTDDICLNGECVHPTIVGCKICSDNDDCDDGNPCTTDSCSAQECTHTAVPGCGPCSVDGDCDDSNLCTVDTCINDVCEHVPIAGCTFCTDDGDCDDANPCTLDTCAVDGCENPPIPGCLVCAVDGDCEDGDACTVDRCGPDGRCSNMDATCFTAVSCSFFNGLAMESCAGERIPRTLSRLINRAGCKLEQAEKRAASGRPRVEKKLKIAQRSLAKAMKKIGKAQERRLSAPCAGALLAEIGDRSNRIAALADQANGGSQLAACTDDLTTGVVAPTQPPGPSLCGKR